MGIFKTSPNGYYLLSRGDIMKKIATVFALLFALSGCTQQSNTQVQQTALDTANISYNTQTIKDILNENIWNYDEESLVIGSEPLATAESAIFNEICEASEAAGIDTRHFKHGAKQTMTIEAKLFNTDMSSAGTAYFAFNKRELLCGYYIYNDVCQSLTDKYPYEYAGALKAFEDKTSEAKFTPQTRDAVFNEIGDIYGGDTAVLSGSALIFYKDTQSGLKRRDSFSFEDELMPVSVSIGRDFSAVLLDSYETADASSGDYEVSNEDVDIVNQKSKKIVFIDKDGDRPFSDIELELSIYSSVARLKDGSVAAARNNAIDIFKPDGSGWKKAERLSVDTAAEKLKIADIDGNGTEEFIISDGVNIYIYTREDRLKLAWRTKFNISAVTDFFAADLNGDGIKEIYVNDSNGFMTRYVAGAKGFDIYGGGIANGENVYFAAGDINGDGKDEYLTVDDEEMCIYK